MDLQSSLTDQLQTPSCPNPKNTFPTFNLSTMQTVQPQTFFLTTDYSDLDVRINLNSFVDINDVLKGDNLTDVHQLEFLVELHSWQGQERQRIRTKPFSAKNSPKKVVVFRCKYAALSLDARIGITVFSTTLPYDSNKPLGSTVIELFNDRGELRQGKCHLFVWPGVPADMSDTNLTPSLTKDPNVEAINSISAKIEGATVKDHELRDVKGSALAVELYYSYKLIPVVFLEVQFPKFGALVLFDDRMCEDYKKACQLKMETNIELSEVITVSDPEFQLNMPDPLEEAFNFLRRENEEDIERLEPNRQELRQIEQIAGRSFRVHLKNSLEEELFIKYRYFLSNDAKYLCYYVHCLHEGVTTEAQLKSLLARWKKVSLGDALHLLSKQFAVKPLYAKKKHLAPQYIVVREYAVSVLEDIDDEQLRSVLLQLVQSLRYEKAPALNSLFQLLCKRAQNSSQIGVLLYWLMQSETDCLPSTNKKELPSVKELATDTMATYTQLLRALTNYLGENSQSTMEIILKQVKLLEFFRRASTIIKKLGTIDERKSQLRRMLAEQPWQAYGGIPYPLNIDLIIIAPIPPECTVFQSAMAPFKLTFRTADQSSFSFIFKSGDDLRQDQLILQIFSLMDQLLKRVGQDYKLTPYKALACSRYDGYVQFVPNTHTFQDIKISDYVTQLQAKYKGAMDNYIASCAGYCAITYFFGIGDRHLENLMIDDTGRMFHIDFGFILGRDPKPMPPAIKLSNQMIKAMGGKSDRNFVSFRTKCLEAYIHLRRHAKLVYNLFYLMLDSGIKDVHTEGLMKLEEKFLNELNDVLAERHFLSLLEDCMNALFPSINDDIHRMATILKRT